MLYHATKHALEGWSDRLRIELADKGIEVVVAKPGSIRTDFGRAMVRILWQYLRTSAFSQLTETVVKEADNFVEAGLSSPPEIITNTVAKAARSRKPKTR
jgi:NAD(P)-dependent dehydrogenase (short-subunit alcohol dehydrogenase family)